MSNPCKKCDQLQNVAPGNAPPRQEFRQPTMYDHLDAFSKFKQEKANAKKVNAVKEDLLKFNQKFTDFNLANDAFDKFSTHEITKFRSSLRHGQLLCPKETADPIDLWKEQNELKPTVSLTTISRIPVCCPVTKCSRTIGVTSVLSHFLLDHSEGLVVQCQNLYSGGRCIVLFNRNLLNFGENVCLGVLSYGGVEDVLESRPALRGICKQNSFLSEAHAHLENHLPVLVMVCLTSIDAMLGDRELAEQLMNPEDKSKQILVIWLATVQTMKPIHSTITAFDEAMTSSRSTIVRVRSMETSQNPLDFLSSDINYLMMNCGEVDILSENGTKSVQLEIKIQEFDA